MYSGLDSRWSCLGSFVDWNCRKRRANPFKHCRSDPMVNSPNTPAEVRNGVTLFILCYKQKGCYGTDLSRVLYQCRQILVSIVALYTVLAPGLPHGFLSSVFPSSAKIRWKKLTDHFFFRSGESTNGIQEQLCLFFGERISCFGGVASRVPLGGGYFWEDIFSDRSCFQFYRSFPAHQKRTFFGFFSKWGIRNFMKIPEH